MEAADDMHDGTIELAPLARRAATLSTHLDGLGERCGHADTKNDIRAIAGDLLRLSSTLARLHEATEADQDHYTAAFRQDLDEITTELQLLLEEIGECCVEMQKSDTPGPVPWFFKKGRVARLQKHLVALKTTLIVMRTVLHHGKDYGIQTSPGRLAESTPHTLYEDRAILDSILAKNRTAIMDLHNIEKEKSHQLSSSTSSETKIDPGAHGRNLSNLTGVDLSPVPDVLPNGPEPKDQHSEAKGPKSNLQRRFSKRGVRLGVHASILDMGAHETTAALRKRWLQQAHSSQTSDSSHHKRMTTISEDGVGARQQATEDGSVDGDGDSQDHTKESSNEGKKAVVQGRKRGNSLKLIGSPIGKAMTKLVHRLSLSSHDGPKYSNHSNGEATRAGKAENGIVKKISDHFRKPDLTTPDWNEEFENGALANMKTKY